MRASQKSKIRRCNWYGTLDDGTDPAGNKPVLHSIYSACAVVAIYPRLLLDSMADAVGNGGAG